MWLSDEEARHQFCPLLLAAPKIERPECRASDCMMWRSKKFWHAGEHRFLGHCGLANEPDENLDFF
jgi:hypothetical protein